MKIKIQNKEIEIKTIPIKRYPDLLKKIKILPDYLNEISGKDNSSIILMGPEIIANCTPDIVAIFSEATGVSEDEIFEYGLKDLIDLFVAIVEQNQFQEALEKLKKGFAHKVEENKTSNKQSS